MEQHQYICEICGQIGLSRSVKNFHTKDFPEQLKWDDTYVHRKKSLGCMDKFLEEFEVDFKNPYEGLYRIKKLSKSLEEEPQPPKVE